MFVGEISNILFPCASFSFTFLVLHFRLRSLCFIFVYFPCASFSVFVSTSCLRRLVFVQCCLVVYMYHLMSGRLKSLARIFILVLLFANRDRDFLSWSMALIPFSGG